MGNPTLAAALAYAANGIPVFPVRPDKRPYKGTAGFKDATCDPDQIKAWWEAHPEAMIGIPTGETSDLFVVDVDNKPDRNGLAALKRMKIHDNAPEVRTPSGGIHRYYRYGSSGLRNTQSKLGPGIDTRGNGGYVVAPPSTAVGGGCYAWVGDRDYRDRSAIPPTLLAKLVTDPDLDALLEACERISRASEGERNGTLNTEAFKIAKRGKVDPSVARKALREAALDCGLDPREIEATLNSAFSSGEREGRKSKIKSTAHAIELRSIEPWPQPVDGARLLSDIKQAIKRHVVLTDDQARAVALWVLHAHCVHFVRLSPRLFISGATKRTGKSTLLSVIEELVPKPLATGNITMAAMFRIVDLEQPTVLIDEIDSFITGRDAPAGREMRGLLNEGYTARGRYHRTAGDDHSVTAYNVYAATVLAGIGRLPDTVADRSITIQLQRKLPSETVERLEFDNTGHLTQLASQAARWAADNGETLKALRPDLPEVLNDRQRDNWKPLFQIAQAVSPKFLSAAQKAAVALSETADADEDDLGVMLLRDIATIHAGLINPGDFIATSTLIGALVAVEEAPWATLMRGDKPITGQRLRSLLRRFAVINPGRDSTGKTRGYRWKDFQKVWPRYPRREA